MLKMFRQLGPLSRGLSFVIIPLMTTVSVALLFTLVFVSTVASTFVSSVALAETPPPAKLKVVRSSVALQHVVRKPAPRRTRARLPAKRVNVGTKSSVRSKSSDNSSLFLDPEVQLDATQDLLANSSTSQNNSQALSYYRSLTQAKYFHDDTSSSTFEELESRNFAEHVFVYYGTRELIDFIRRSPLGSDYRQLSKRMKRYTETLSAGVSRAPNGELQLSHGAKKRHRFLDLGVGFNSRTWVEPKLNLNENFNLRYNPVDSRAVIQYELDF